LSWIDPRIGIRGSIIAGLGMYARAPISAGDVVIRWGGVVMDRAAIRAGLARLQSIISLDDGTFLVDPLGPTAQPDEYMNHSCDSNLWMLSATVLAARRDIVVDEEITCDYALFHNADWCLDPSHRMTCRCGSPLCRGVVNGDDFRHPAVIAQYGDHCAPYLLAERQLVAV
jgi:hypothetical protein